MARSIVVQIIGDASQLEREFRKAGDSSDKLTKRLGLNAKTIAKGGAIAGAGLAVAGAAKFLTGSVSAAKEAEKAEFRLNQAFDATAVSAAKRRKALAAVNKVSKQAALDDEDLSDVLAKLTRSTGSVEKGMKGMGLAAQIARARDIPLATAAKAVEMAMLGKDTALRKLGVVVPKVTAAEDKLKAKINVLKEASKKATGAAKEKIKAQIEDLKSQVKMAKQMDKTATAQAGLQKAQRLFAGAAEKYGKTTAGAQEKLAVAWENLQERVGKKLLPVLTKLSLWGVRFLDWSERNWPQFSKTVSDAFNKVKPVILVVTKYIEGVYNGVKQTVRLVSAILQGDWSKAWDAAKKIVTQSIFKILDAITTLPRKIIAKLTGAAWDGLKKVGTKIKDAIVGGLTAAIDGIIGAIVNAINRVIRIANAAIGKINKVSPFADIPKIAEVGSPGSSSRTSPGQVQPGTRRSGPRDRGQPFRSPASVSTQGAPTSQSVVLVVDHRELGRVTLNQQQRTARGTAASRRGPHAGRGLALG